jgi:ADP-heptose:LPS heptosyltransferase
LAAKPRSLVNQAAQRFLFLQYELPLGTAIHATPLFEALRRARPDADITVAGSGLTCEVLKYNPNINRLVETPHPLKRRGQALLFFLKDFYRRGNDFDCIITDSGNRRSFINLLGALAGGARRIGFRCRWDLNHTSLEYDLGKSVIENNLRLLEALGHTYESTEPAVYYSRDEVDKVRVLLSVLGIAAEQPLVAIQTQTSGGEPNRWYDDRFRALADLLHRDTKAQILFVGTKSERERIESIRREMSAPSFCAAGCTDIPQLAALLSGCDLLITLNTGTMNLGRAVTVPMVVISHAKDPLYEWLPAASERVRILVRADIPCACCRKLHCSTRECMDEISVGEALAASQEQLGKFPPSMSARRERQAKWTVVKSF